MKILQLLVLLPVVFAFQQVLKLEPLRVAIIGAGAGGSSAAYHLHKFMGDAAINVTIFEQSSYVGGRSTTINIYDNESYPMELGASIFVGANKILENARETFNLSVKDEDNLKLMKQLRNKTNEVIGFFNGTDMVFELKLDQGWFRDSFSVLRLFWKYGLSPYKSYKLTQNFISTFLINYYESSFPFTNLNQPGERSKFNEAYTLTGEEYLNSLKISSSFNYDIIQSLTRVNYASNLNQIHGVETLVSIAAEDAKQIKGGNWKMFEGFISASNASLLLDTKVSNFTKTNQGWQITFEKNESIEVETFDKLIIAAPFYQTDILENLDDNLKTLISNTIPIVNYTTLYTTIFTSSSELNHDFFKIKNDHDYLDTVLTSPGDPSLDFEKLNFNSLSVHNYIKETDEFVYKLFSLNDLSLDYISKTFLEFDNITWSYKKIWKSYPQLPPIDTFIDFEIDEGLYYLNTMETLISTMETSALAGANVAGLISSNKNITEISIPH